jgi:phosphatidate cytidylyltransferase
MKRVLTAVVLIAIVLVVTLKAPTFLFTFFLGIAALAALREYLGLLVKQGLVPLRAFSYVLFFLWFGFLVAFFVVSYSRGVIVPDSFGLPLLGGLGLLGIVPLAGSFYLRSADLKSALPSLGSEIFAFIYIALSLSCLSVLHAEAGGWLLLLFLFIVVWSGDIAALYFGKLFGKHKLAPRISPGKTWEGALASLISAVILGWAWIHFTVPIFRSNWVLGGGPVGVLYPKELAASNGTLRPASIFLIIGIAGTVNIASQLGDLFESMIKRAAEVKDSGTLLPGHGGILDRIDALLFAAPLFYLLVLMFLHT